MFFHKITIHKLFGLVFRICKIAQFHFFRGVTITIVQLHVFGSISAVTFIIVLTVSLIPIQSPPTELAASWEFHVKPSASLDAATGTALLFVNDEVLAAIWLVLV